MFLFETVTSKAVPDMECNYSRGTDISPHLKERTGGVIQKADTARDSLTLVFESTQTQFSSCPPAWSLFRFWLLWKQIADLARQDASGWYGDGPLPATSYPSKRHKRCITTLKKYSDDLAKWNRVTAFLGTPSSWKWSSSKIIIFTLFTCLITW